MKNRNSEPERAPGVGNNTLGNAASDSALDALSSDATLRDATSSDTLSSDVSLSDAQLRAILSHVADGVLMVDMRGVVVFENEAARGIYFTSLMNQDVLKTLPPWTLLDFRRQPFTSETLPLRRAILHGETLRGVDIVVPISPEIEFVIQISAVPIRDENGRQTASVLTLHNATEERRLTRELSKINRSKDDFLAILSHELRTPLTPILGWASLLQQVGREDDEIFAQAIQSIERNAETMKRLVNDLLDTTRIVSGKLSTRKTTCDLNEIARVAAQSIESDARTANVHIRCELAPALPLLWCDSERLHQVLMNLLTNAVKFSSPDGTVHLRTRNEIVDTSSTRFEAANTEAANADGANADGANADGANADGANAEAADVEATNVEGAKHVLSQIIVEIEDGGQGIAPELLPHVFELFRQGDSSFTRNHGGLGLGLAISRSLVQMHGGTLVAHSDGLGKGARFALTLPVFDVH